MRALGRSSVGRRVITRQQQHTKNAWIVKRTSFSGSLAARAQYHTHEKIKNEKKNTFVVVDLYLEGASLLLWVNHHKFVI
jgi:hypothetical protein